MPMSEETREFYEANKHKMSKRARSWFEEGHADYLEEHICIQVVAEPGDLIRPPRTPARTK